MADGEQSSRRFRCLHDVYDARSAGDDVSPDLIRTFERDDALCRAALNWPGALLTSAVRETMLEGSDYAVFWSAATKLYKVLAESGDPTARGALKPDDVLAAMRDRKPERFNSRAGEAWMGHLMGRSNVSLAYALEVLVPERVAAHHVREFRDKTSSLNEKVGAADSVTVYNEYVSTAYAISQVPDGGRVAGSISEHLDDPLQAQGLVVPCGIAELDRLMGGGPCRGDLVVIGGGTNHGKSYFGEQLLHMAALADYRFLYLSIEDAKEIMTCRMTARHTDPPMMPVVIRGEGKGPLAKMYSREVHERAKASLKAHDNARMFVDVRRKAKLSEVCQVMRRYRYQKAVDAIFVDYLQAIQPDVASKTGNLIHETAEKVAELKRVAGDLGVVLYLGSQYSRESYKNGEEPGINACKYAGDIENESEVMILFWRDTDDVLHAKLPKIKWVKGGKSAARFFVRTHDVTGHFLRWEEDWNQQTGGSQGGAGPRSSRQTGRPRPSFP